MSNFIIKLGTINKKMIIMLIYIILFISINIYSLYFEYNEVFLFIDGFGYSLGEISTFFIAQIFRYRRISNKKKKTIMKHYFKDYSILFAISVLYMILRLLPFYILKTDEKDKDKYKDLFLNESLEIIEVTLVSYFFLNNKYYIHHIISLIMLVIITVIIDLILGNYKHIVASLVITSILYIIADSFLYAYSKYLMEKKYYYFIDLLIASGAFDLILYIIAFTIINIVQKAKGTNELIFQFFEFYKNYGARQIILIFLVALIPEGLLLFFIEMQTLDILGINFMYISYQISKIPSMIIKIEGSNRWIVLALSFVQIFFFLFYLEILEFNFCNLNKNTKRNIKEREIQQSIEENNEDEDYEIDIKGYDFSENVKIQNKIEDLNEMKEIFEEKEKDY